jgi:hypothetical protein
MERTRCVEMGGQCRWVPSAQQARHLHPRFPWMQQQGKQGILPLPVLPGQGGGCPAFLRRVFADDFKVRRPG